MLPVGGLTDEEQNNVATTLTVCLPVNNPKTRMSSKRIQTTNGNPKK